MMDESTIVAYGIGMNFNQKYPFLFENGIQIDYVADKKWEHCDDASTYNGIPIISFDRIRKEHRITIIFFPDSEIVAEIVRNTFPHAKFVYAEALCTEISLERDYPLEMVLSNYINHNEKSKMDIEKYLSREIDSSDITVVMQGPILNKRTPEAIRSIRRLFPKSKLIVSTWLGENTDSLDVDIIVKSIDPGGQQMPGSRQIDNRNRQLLSTQKGLEKVESKYCIKTRTDLYLLNADFLKYFNGFPKRKKEYTFFSYRLISNQYYYLSNPYSDKACVPMPMYISDWFFFGLTEDVKKYFMGTAPASSEQYTDKYVRSMMYPEGYFLCPEQYFATKAFGTEYPEIAFTDLMKTTYEQQELSYQLIMNNFIILDESHLCVEYAKTQRNRNTYIVKDFYSQDDFIKYYERI